MRRDSIEFGWAQQATRQRRMAGAASFVPSRAPIAQLAATDVMDEAFARFDSAVDDRKSPLVDQSLVATVAAQLEALDRQREHLANLLRSIEVCSTTSPSAVH